MMAATISHNSRSVLVTNSSILSINTSYYLQSNDNNKSKTYESSPQSVSVTLNSKQTITKHITYRIHYSYQDFQWILSQTNPSIVYYTNHSNSSTPPTNGWIPIAAPESTNSCNLTVDCTGINEQNSNKNDIKIKQQLQQYKLIIKAKQIVVNPSTTVSNGYLFIDSNGIICQIIPENELTNESHRTIEMLITNIRTNTKNTTDEKTKSKDKMQFIECDIICPGLIDIHTHGLGSDISINKRNDARFYYLDPLYTMTRLPKLGTTSFLATIVFPDQLIDDTIKMCQNLKINHWQKLETNGNCAVLEGIHCEGPVVANFGGLPDSTKLISKYNNDLNEFKSLMTKLNNNQLDPNNNFVKIMTISPSVDHPPSSNHNHDHDQDDKDTGNKMFEKISYLISDECKTVAALGHDRNCNEDQILQCLSIPEMAKKIQTQKENEFERKKQETENNDSCKDECKDIMDNIRSPFHLTHVFNVQSFHHRNVGLANFALCPILPNTKKYIKYKLNGINNSHKLPSIEIIGDLVHVSPILIQSILSNYKIKNEIFGNNICFITDGISEAVPNKNINYNPQHPCAVDAYGKTVVNRGTNVICGSCIDMFSIFKSLINVFGCNVNQAAQLCSTNPARIARLDNKIGTLDIGKRGDVILLNDNLDLQATVVNGNVVYKA